MMVAVLSVKGSPGVTTFSLALAARWPRPARTLVVEADPSGGDIGMRFALGSTPGLVSLAAATRRTADAAVVWQHSQQLPGGLPVVSAPPDADRARAALTALTGGSGVSVLRATANAPDTVVIADCGRVDHGCAAMPLVRSADVMVLLTRAASDDLAHLVRRLPVMGRWTPHPVLLLIGKGYATADVARELGVFPLGRVPDDPRGAAMLSGRATRPRWGRSGLAGSALATVAFKVATVLADHHAPPVRPRQGPDEQPPSLHAVPDPRQVPANARQVLSPVEHGAGLRRGEHTS